MAAGGNVNSFVQLNVAQRGVLQNPGGAVQAQPAVAGTTGATAIAARMRKMAARAAVAESSSTQNASDDEAALEGSATASTNGTAVIGNNSTALTNGTAVAQNNSTISTGQAVATQSVAAAAPAAVTPLLLQPTFTQLSGKAVLDRTSGRVAVPITQLDGEYILTMAMVQGGQQQAGQQPGAAQQQPQAEAQAQQTGVTAGAQPAAKRQESAAQSGAGWIMSMSDIMEMATLQANGGVLPVSAMMQEFATAQGQSLR